MQRPAQSRVFSSQLGSTQRVNIWCASHLSLCAVWLKMITPEKTESNTRGSRPLIPERLRGAPGLRGTGCAIQAPAVTSQPPDVLMVLLRFRHWPLSLHRCLCLCVVIWPCDSCLVLCWVLGLECPTWPRLGPGKAEPSRAGRRVRWGQPSRHLVPGSRPGGSSALLGGCRSCRPTASA